MDIRLLKQFLLASNNAGYSGGQEKKWVKESDGSTTIRFASGDFKSHDNFFGGEPYGGRLVVSYKNKPVWIMVYYGWVTEGIDPNPVYEILREALKQMPHDYPYRGPRKYIKGDWAYKNTWHGELDRYDGEETIKQGDMLMYKAHYRGGWVDTRVGV